MTSSLSVSREEVRDELYKVYTDLFVWGAIVMSFGVWMSGSFIGGLVLLTVLTVPYLLMEGHR